MRLDKPTFIESISNHNFNGDYKEYFLRTHTDILNHKVYEDCFDKIKRYELFYGKDVLFFAKSMLEAMFDSLNVDTSDFEVFYSIVVEYYDFYGILFPCQKRQMIDFGELRSKTLQSERELFLVLNAVFEPDEYLTLDVMRKACIILLYYGADKKYIPLIKKEDVSDTSNKIFLSPLGVTRYGIPDMFMSTLRTCKKMTAALSTNERYVSEESKNRMLHDTEYLIRSDSILSDTELVSVPFIEKIFTRNDFSIVDKQLNCTRIVESGFYNWVSRIHQNTEPSIAEFKALYEQYFGKITNRYKIYYQRYIWWKQIA